MGLVPGHASAVEVLPGVELLDVTVTGPGLPDPVVLPEDQALQFAKAWIGITIVPPQVATPSKDAQIYKVRLSLSTNVASGAGNVLVAWDGKAGWLSGGDLLARSEYVPAPPESIAALEGVLPEATTMPTKDEESSGSPTWVLGVGLLIGLVAVVVIVALVVRRGRRSAE
ncbi:MAG: hypothetical protein EXQ69_10950 [Acidimicrobiia bacterium]|nr:hypothetical protein [Acidimicrobiia bacterium]